MNFSCLEPLPPIHEILLIEQLEKALKGLLHPPLIEIVVDYLLGPYRPQTQLQQSYNKTTREFNWLLYEEARVFFDRESEEFSTVKSWMRLHHSNAQTATENLRFVIRAFAFSNNLPYRYTTPSPGPGSVASFQNGKRDWNYNVESGAFRLLLEDQHLADLAIEIGLVKFTPLRMAHLIGRSVSQNSFYETHEGLDQPLWTVDAFVDFLFARVPQIMTTHWAYVIVLNLDYDATKSGFVDTFLRRLPTIDWTKCDPAVKEQIKAEIHDNRVQFYRDLIDQTLLNFRHNLLLQL